MSKISVHHIIVISSASSIILSGEQGTEASPIIGITQKYNFRIGKAESPGYQYFPVII